MSAPPHAPVGTSSHSLLDPSDSSEPSERDKTRSLHAASIREVLACLDGSELGSGLVPHAHQITQALGARLTLLHVLEAEPSTVPDPIPADPLDWGIRRRAAREHLSKALARLGVPDVRIRSELVQGRPAEQICRWAESHDVDLTVLCSHGQHGLTEWGLASTARKLIERIPGSFLLVPADVASRAETKRYRRILVPLDASPRAESVLPIAMRIAENQDAELILVHVVPTPEVVRAGLLDAEASELEHRVLEHNRRAARVYLDRLRSRISQSGARVRGVVVEEGGVRARLDHVIREQEADLVVMSAHGRAGRTDSACGCVTEFALSHASVPILVLRERKHRPIRHGAVPTNRRHVDRPDGAEPEAF
jgi:nucleotide-binding universal stress UspA family protein